MKPRYIVSACLIGARVKYNGDSNFNDRIDYFRKLGAVTPVCPETLGGLSTPRFPSEIINGLVINKNGEDNTPFFDQGALRTLEIAKEFGIYKGILKSNSPSCGIDKIYDGTFSGKLIDGSGVTAKLLLDNEFFLMDEKTQPIYDAIVVAAGKSKRSRTILNKIFEFSIHNTCLEASVLNFLGDYLCDRVIIVANKEDFDIIKVIFNHDKRIILVEGGDCREQSVLNGLKQAQREYVLIHDAARPYLSDMLKDLVLFETMEVGNAVPYTYEANGVDYESNGKYIQTPQGYIREEIQKYLENEKLEDFRDESSIFARYKDVNYIEGDPANKKITTKEDVIEWRNYDGEDYL